MTDSSGKQMQDIEALLAERRKFELWLDQLDGRRTATPNNVYAKVHADYSARLAEAQSRLAAETGAVEALVEKLESSLETHDATIAGRSDELAEAELRASVGEYAEKEWNKLRDKLSLAIAEMTKARDTVLGELEAMRAVLAEASSSKPAQIVEEPVVAPVATPPVAETVASRVSVPVARASEPALVIIDEPAAPVAIPHPTPPAEQSKDRDELAFLRSVLGRSTPATHPGPQTPIEESPSVAGRRSMGSNSSRSSSGTARPSTPELFQESEPLAMPADQARESGAFARTTGSFTMPTSANPEVVKSLKCAECGTLNYPTEWYCERCGGELAAF